MLSTMAMGIHVLIGPAETRLSDGPVSDKAVSHTVD
jgi:hypothetical protein